LPVAALAASPFPAILYFRNTAKQNNKRTGVKILIAISGFCCIFNFKDEENNQKDKHVPYYLTVLEGHGCLPILSTEIY